MVLVLVISLAIVLSGMFFFSVYLGKRHQGIENWNDKTLKFDLYPYRV